MFVRTGTVRKNRGGSSRRHAAPRHRRDSNEHNVPMKTVITVDPPSTGSVVYGLTPNGEIRGSRSVSMSSITYKTGLEYEQHSAAKTDNELHLCSPYKNTMKQGHLTISPSPARSHTTTVVVWIIYLFLV